MDPFYSDDFSFELGSSQSLEGIINAKKQATMENMWSYLEFGVDEADHLETIHEDTYQINQVEDFAIPTSSPTFSEHDDQPIPNNITTSLWDLINFHNESDSVIGNELNTEDVHSLPAASSYHEPEPEPTQFQQYRHFLHHSGDCSDQKFNNSFQSYDRSASTTLESLLSPSPDILSIGPAFQSPRSCASTKPISMKFERRRSISKMPLTELYEVMGLGHDHNAALEREEFIMSILEREGFDVGEKTWIRDTEEPVRRAILDTVYGETFEAFGYSKRLIEAIIRRGTYARMQSNLRRMRRRRRRINGNN